MPRAAMRKTKTSTTKKTKKSHPVKSSAKKKAPVKSVKKVVKDPVETKTVTAPPPTTKRRSPTRESVLEDFESLIMSVDAEIQHLREGREGEDDLPVPGSGHEIHQCRSRRVDVPTIRTRASSSRSPSRKRWLSSRVGIRRNCAHG